MRKNQVPDLPSHGACGQLVALTLQHLPRDRKLGSFQRYEKGERIWAPEDFADRVYFLKTGQVVIRTSKIQGRDFVLQLVQAQHPFGELCCCSVAGGLRHSAAYAVTESAAIEISLNHFLQYLKTPEMHSWPSWSACVFDSLKRSEAPRCSRIAGRRHGSEDCCCNSPPGGVELKQNLPGR
jgi:CRP-like cAMP-binding protein